MAKTVDYYKLLGISIFASEQEIRSAYLAKIKQYHPDTYKGSKKEAENVTAEINVAYDTLCDKDKKFVYDMTYGFDIKRSEYLRQKAKEEKKEKKQQKKKDRKKPNVTNGDYAPEKKAKEKTEREAQFNQETAQKDEKIKTNIFTKEPKKDTKQVHHKVKTPEEKQTLRERISLDVIIILLVIIAILLIISFNK